MRFIFVTDELPRPGRAGHLAMNHAIVDWLQSLGHEVIILLTSARLAWPIERYAVAPMAGPEVVSRNGAVIAISPRGLAGIVARRLLAQLPPRLMASLRRRARAQRHGEADEVLGAFMTPAQVAWCARHIAKAPPDAIIIDTMFRASLLQEPGLAGLRAVIMAPDVFHHRHQTLIAAGYRVHPAQLPAALEAELLNYAHALVAIQPEEAASLQALCPNREIVTAPMPARPAPRPTTIVKLANRLVFIGSAALPNLDGIRWFLASVWPQLSQSRPGITLDIIGDCGAALPSLPPGVNRLGRVTELAAVLHRASLAIAPLRVGSGLKIKLLDYARHGLLTVATPAALTGFAADPAAPFIAANNAPDFIAAILRQFDAGGGETRALAYVERHYGRQSSFAGLAKVLGIDDVAPAPDQPGAFSKN